MELQELNRQNDTVPAEGDSPSNAESDELLTSTIAVRVVSSPQT